MQKKCDTTVYQHCCTLDVDLIWNEVAIWKFKKADSLSIRTRYIGKLVSNNVKIKLNITRGIKRIHIRLNNLEHGIHTHVQNSSIHVQFYWYFCTLPRMQNTVQYILYTHDTGELLPRSSTTQFVHALSFQFVHAICMVHACVHVHGAWSVRNGSLRRMPRDKLGLTRSGGKQRWRRYSQACRLWTYSRRQPGRLPLRSLLVTSRIL